MKNMSAKRFLALFLACLTIVSSCLIVSVGADSGSSDDLTLKGYPLEWQFDSGGTGMPDPDDPNEGLPYDAMPEIKEYGCAYKPYVYGYGEDGDVDMTNLITTAKAGDVIWLKVSFTGIERDRLKADAKNYIGFHGWEGYVSYNANDILRFYADVGVDHLKVVNGTGLSDITYLNEFLHFSTCEGMPPLYKLSLSINWAHVFYDEYPPNDWLLSSGTTGTGLHFSILLDGAQTSSGVWEDDQLYICIPLQITKDAEDGKEYTFTVPYPSIEEFGLLYYWEFDERIQKDQLRIEECYARGGSYTITISNYDEVEDNLASSATYAVSVGGADFGTFEKGNLNDLKYPLTDNTDHTLIDTSADGTADLYFKLASLSDVDDVVLTFNDTDEADLPEKVDVYGVKADGNKTFLGTIDNYTAYYSGVTDTKNYNLGENRSVTVNAANAYQYKLSDIDTAKYTGVYFEIIAKSTTSDDGVTTYSKTALGEVEIKGTAQKVSVSVENGTISGASEDGLYYPGTTLTIVADELDHKEFSEWTTANNSGTFGDVATSTTTFVVGNSDETITATYDDVLYSLNVVNGTANGTSGTTAQQKYGGTVAIKADAPADNMVFDKWVVSVSGTAVVDNPTSPDAVVTVYDQATVTATYKNCYTLTVTDGTGSGSYAPNTDADISANDAASGKMFYKWDIVRGDVDFVDQYAASTKVTVNSDATVKAVYVDIYKPVPDNLVNNETTMTVLDGTVTDGSVGDLKDRLYPIVSNGNWMTATDGDEVLLAIDLFDTYDLSSAAFNFSLPDGKTVFTDTITVYGANNADYSDKTVIGTLASVNSVTGEKITFPDGINLTSNSTRYTLELDSTNGYRYVIVSFSTDYIWTIPGYGTYSNSVIKIGEIEIYGDLTTYEINVVDGEIVSASSSAVDGEYYAGTVLTVEPNDDTNVVAFEKWVASVGAVESSDGVYTYTVSADATLTATFTEINKPVPDNLIPTSDVALNKGTLTAGLQDYVADSLYPITSGAKWATYAPTDKEVSFMVDLGDYYDVSSASFTLRTTTASESILLPSSITVIGSNNADGSDGVTIMTAANALTSGFNAINFSDFGVQSDLQAVAVKYALNATDVASYRYLKIVFSAQYATAISNAYPNPIFQIGELEVYGTESLFEVTVTNGTVVNGNANDLYDDGTVLNITADTIPHKTFSRWKVYGKGEIADSTSASTTFTVSNSDATITAVYDDVLYSLNVVYGTGTGDYVYSTVVDVVADAPTDAELVFDKWVADSDNVVIADPSNPQTKVTVNGNGKVTAQYKNRIYSFTVENGTGSGNYTKDQTASVSANAPAADMKFDHWEIVTGSCTITDVNSADTTVITSNEATTIRAIYTDILYSVDVKNGAIDEDDVQDGYKVGTVISITADVLPHKSFSHWTLEGSGTFADVNSADTEFTTGSGDMVITAVYDDVLYSLTVVNGTGSGDYQYDAEASLVAKAPDGAKYVFNGWTITSGAENLVYDDLTSESIIVSVRGNAVIESNWILVYDATVINGTITEETQKDYYLAGDTFEVVADAAAENKEFIGWVIVSGDAVLDDASATSATVTVGSSDVIVRSEYTDVLYKFTIENGAADNYDKDGVPVGTEITIVADPAPEGYEFDKWVIVSGKGSIADESAENTEFVMGGSDTVIKATYKESSAVGTGDNGIAAFALLSLIALAGICVVAKKKAK